jgi:hypothetical protein
MLSRRLVRRWLRLPGRLALLLGLGALSTAGVRADASENHEPAGRGDVLIRSQGGHIYLSQDGKPFEPLPLSDTEEARRLRQLVEQRGKSLGSDRLRLNPTVLAGGGGASIHWWGPADKTNPPEKTGTPNKGETPKEADKPRNTDSSGAGKKG